MAAKTRKRMPKEKSVAAAIGRKIKATAASAHKSKPRRVADPDELLTTTQVARILGISRQVTLRYMISQRIKSELIGPVRVARRRDVDLFCEIPRARGRKKKSA